MSDALSKDDFVATPSRPRLANKSKGAVWRSGGGAAPPPIPIDFGDIERRRQKMKLGPPAVHQGSAETPSPTMYATLRRHKEDSLRRTKSKNSLKRQSKEENDTKENV